MSARCALEKPRLRRAEEPRATYAPIFQEPGIRFPREIHEISFGGACADALLPSDT